MLSRALQELSKAVVLQGSSEGVLTGVAIDTRLLQPGNLFIALPTEKRDGHDFITAAIEKGAIAVIVSKHLEMLPHLPEQIRVIKVPDTYLALRELGRWFRSNVLHCPMIAITGSYAKTTVKTFTAEVLKELGEGLVTSGNFNNLLGVPLTLTKAVPEHKYGLFELGMNRYGEISELTRICRPDFGLITHIGRAHLEFFGSEWGVAQAKGELFSEMLPDAVRIVNLDDPFIRDLAVAYPGTNDVGYTLHGEISGFKGRVVHAKVVAPDDQGNYGIQIEKTIIRSPLPGRHQTENLLAAGVIGQAMGISFDRIADRIAGLQDIPMRSQIVNVGGVRIIRDEYNASLHSMIAAVDLLCELPNVRHRIAVLGDMFELGKWSRVDHEMLGESIAKKPLSAVYTTGEMCRYAHQRLVEDGMRNVFHSDTIDDIIAELCATVSEGDAILIKGSRGMALERISEALIAHLQTAGVK